MWSTAYYGGYPMMGYGGYGGYEIMHLVFSIISIVILIAVIMMVIRFARGGKAWHSHHGFSGNTALDILKERYAKGEIDKTEFEEKKKDLS